MTYDELLILNKNIKDSLLKHESSIAVKSLVQYYNKVISETK
jgi:hypothetical protein